MRLPQDYILHIESAKDGVHITAEWQGELVRCKDCVHNIKTEDGEYVPEDIVCNYWMSDGLDSNDFCSYGERRETTIPMFKESAEAYKAWTGEDMGGDEINEMNRDIIKDILKMMPTAYLLEALQRR